MDDNNNEVVDMINKLVDSGIINNPESVKILTDYHIKMSEIQIEKEKIFKDELESMFNFGVNLIDHGISIMERHNEIEQSQQ